MPADEVDLSYRHLAQDAAGVEVVEQDIDRDAGDLEGRLMGVRDALVEIDERRGALIRERDEVMRALADEPYLRSTRRLGALGGCTHQNAALIVRPLRPR